MLSSWAEKASLLHINKLWESGQTMAMPKLVGANDKFYKYQELRQLATLSFMKNFNLH